jgi:hypothetical protein
MRVTVTPLRYGKLGGFSASTYEGRGQKSPDHVTSVNKTIMPQPCSPLTACPDAERPLPNGRKPSPYTKLASP